MDHRGKADTLVWSTSDRPEASLDRKIDQGLDDSNALAAPSLGQVRELRATAHLPWGPLVGGARARTWGECVSLDQIWVDPDHRRQGLATGLIERIEAEARSRGCTLLYLETFSFQAPELYLGMSFEIAAEFAGFPDGIVKYVMRKDLSR